MADEVLLEELEVLESIYPTELTKLSEREVSIDVEPEEAIDGGANLKLALKVTYPDQYPDVLPELDMQSIEGDLTNEELNLLHEQMKSVGEENIGMAMTFTLVALLREKLLEIVKERLERQKQAEAEEERRRLEEEEAKTKGTPVTIEAFTAWKARFDKEMAARRNREEEERLKGLSIKEREEFKKLHFRPSGKQLFEKNSHLEDDENLVEEGDVSVDLSQFERTHQNEDEQEQDRLEFSDSTDSD